MSGESLDHGGPFAFLATRDRGRVARPAADKEGRFAFGRQVRRRRHDELFSAALKPPHSPLKVSRALQSLIWQQGRGRPLELFGHAVGG